MPETLQTIYTENHGLILINVPNITIRYSLIANGAASRTGVKDSRHIKSTISPGTYSIDDFNTKIKAAVLQQRSDWNMPQFKDLNLVISDYYNFMTSN